MLPEPTLTSAQCLDALEQNLRTVLLHTGSALHESANFDANSIALTKLRVAQHLPPALDEFQRALRNLELELVRAQSALQRDLTASRQARAATSKTASAKSPRSVELDADTVMLEAPAQNETSELAVSLDRPEEASKNGAATDMEVDPLEQPMQTTDKANVANNAAAGPDASQEQNPSQQQQISNTANGESSTGPQIAEVASANAIQNGEQADLSSATDQSKNNDDISLLFGVEQYARDDTANDAAGNSQLSSKDGVDSVQPEGQDGNTLDPSALKERELQGDATLSTEAANNLAGSFDFDFGNFDFGIDADGAGEANAEGTGQGDGQGWDSSFFDENFFNLDSLS